MITFKYNRKDLEKQQGVTLLLAIIVLSSVLAISFSLATILFIEIRTSGDLLKSESVINAAGAVSEEALFYVKRQILPCGQILPGGGTVTANCSPYSTSVGSVDLSNPPPTPALFQDAILQAQILPTNTSTNPVIYSLYDPTTNLGAGSGYGKVRITYLDTGHTDNLIVYICNFNPANPTPLQTDVPPVCTHYTPVSPQDSYWLAGAYNDTYITPGFFKDYDFSNPSNNMQQEIILVNGTGNHTIYLQIEAFDYLTGAPKGIPFFGEQAVDVTANASGITRKVRVFVPE